MKRIGLLLLSLFATLDAYAQVHAAPSAPTSVPALDEIGLLGLAVVVGLVAGWLVKRK